MFRVLSDRVDRAEATHLAATLVAEVARETEDPQLSYRLKLICALADWVSDASTGDLAARLIAAIPPYHYIGSRPASIDAIRSLAAHADARGATLVIAALVEMTIVANRWDYDSEETAARIIEAIPAVRTSQQWVDLLKVPTCLGPMREASLRQLI
jgi:hypothetical protein